MAHKINFNKKIESTVLYSTAKSLVRFWTNIGEIRQPKSEKYEAVVNLSFVTDEFSELLKKSEKNDNTLSCSIAEALENQGLFINFSLTQMGCSLLWN